MNNVDVFDIEQFPNLHTYTGISNDGNNTVTVFEISERKNEIKEYIKYLRELAGMIGFNNVAYDYPMLHYILTNESILISLDNNDINNLLYEESQRIINAEWSSVPEWDVIIPQLDLFLIKHYNNSARSTSLKYLEFTLRWPKLQDLPFKFNEEILYENIQNVVDYNLNDVLATQHFMNKECLEDIEFRKVMTSKLSKNVMNYSDVKLGEYINQITYEKLSGREYKQFNKLRTYHKVFRLSDIIEDTIEFKTKYLQDFLIDIKVKTFESEDDNIIDTHLTFANNTFKFAKGGLHSEDIPRIVTSDDEILMEKDVASYYPKSIVNSKLYPKHLGVEWYNGVTGMFNRRTYEIKPILNQLKKSGKKDTDEYKTLNTEQASIKLSLNGGIFGKLGSVYSWQYDPLQKYKITINCELKLLMLIEEFDLNNIKIISANTDGVVIKYKKSQQDIVDKIHKEWEDKFNYELENTYYKKIIFSSVNDYLAEIIDENGKFLYCKFKGDYEIDSDPHKNNSQRIVPICLKEYFINGIQPRDIISKLGYEFKNSKDKLENTTIYDYCIGKKKDKQQLYHYVEKNKTTTITDKVIRYYIVDPNKSQNKIFKEYLGGKKGEKAKETGKPAIEAVSKGFNHMLFMNYKDSDDYMIDEIYYVQECMKIIEPIERNTRLLNTPKSEQLKLF